ncbi:MAG: biopolymer transporter ExbD [Verrucomicrobium sp.]|nr:biopolymer transporter ExbD [Verrucomicrobium sp.]
MRLPRRLPYLRGPLEAAPAVTVVLLLLFFFILSTSFVLQPGIKVELPRSPWGSGVSAQSPIVTVFMSSPQPDENGVAQPRRPMLFFNDEIIQMPDLEERLEKLGHGAAPGPGRALMIKADRDVPNGVLVEIMNRAMAQKWSVVLATRRPDGS